MRAPSIILITGIMASGKSTTAQRLAERLSKSVHLRGDVFRRMIVSGQAKIEAPLSESALEQLRLRYRVAASAAHIYCDAGFTVVYQDVILGPILSEVVEILKGKHPVYVIVLCPSAEVVTQREARRHKVGYTSWSPDSLDRELRTNTPKIGIWLDTSDLTLEQSVDSIMTRIEEAVVPSS
jgi:chloramphenicol 3-O-phosphotransferase